MNTYLWSCGDASIRKVHVDVLGGARPPGAREVKRRFLPLRVEKDRRRSELNSRGMFEATPRALRWSACFWTESRFFGGTLLGGGWLRPLCYSNAGRLGARLTSCSHCVVFTQVHVPNRSAPLPSPPLDQREVFARRGEGGGALCAAAQGPQRHGQPKHAHLCAPFVTHTHPPTGYKCPCVPACSSLDHPAALSAQQPRPACFTTAGGTQPASTNTQTAASLFPLPCGPRSLTRR